MKDEQLLDIALLAGKVLSLANAEAYRIEDTMMRILSNTSFDQVAVLAQSTNIIVCLQDMLGNKNTRMIRIQGHNLALDKIHKVNEISRLLCNQSLEYKQAYEQLQLLLDKPDTKVSRSALFGLWMLGPAFVLVFKGGISEVLMVTVLSTLYVLLYAYAWKLNTLLLYLLASTMIAFCSILFQQITSFYGVEIVPDIVIISAIMPMVPGIAITNSLRDILNQDYVSGMTKLLESLAQAGSIAFGIGFGYALGTLI